MYVLIMARDKPFREFIASNEASRHESKTQAAVPDFRHVGTTEARGLQLHVCPSYFVYGTLLNQSRYCNVFFRGIMYAMVYE